LAFGKSLSGLGVARVVVVCPETGNCATVFEDSDNNPRNSRKFSKNNERFMMRNLFIWYFNLFILQFSKKMAVLMVSHFTNIFSIAIFIPLHETLFFEKRAKPQGWENLLP